MTDSAVERVRELDRKLGELAAIAAAANALYSPTLEPGSRRAELFVGLLEAVENEAAFACADAERLLNGLESGDIA